MTRVPISDVIVDTHQKLLSGGGVWCILTMTYTHDDEADVRWVIADLKPIQVAGVSLEPLGPIWSHQHKL